MSYPARTTDRDSPAEVIAWLLSAASIFVSLAGIAYRPLRLIPFAILLALVATVMATRNTRLASIAIGVGAAAFVLGMAVAVVTETPLY